MRTTLLMAFALAVAPALAHDDHAPKPREHAHDAAKPAPGMARAEAQIGALGGSAVTGRAAFRRVDGSVELDLVVEHLPAGAHAVHLHEKGDCSSPDGMSAGGHWNPSSEAHGKWGASPFHHGDLGNLVPGPDGTARLTVTTDLWTIGDGSGSDVVGRSIIVHAKEDDFETQPTGNAGGRIACGVVRPGE